jgi:hypothetical protein
LYFGTELVLSYAIRYPKSIPMKPQKSSLKTGSIAFMIGWALILNSSLANAQSCPTSGTTLLSSFPNTFFPGTQANVGSGGKSITLGPATLGTTPIAAGDIVLIVQMQGAQFNQTNGGVYGDGKGGGTGYLNNTGLTAGCMEFAIAKNSVPLAGGTLQLVSGVFYNYQNSAYGTDGQYTYQVLQVPTYYNVQLTSTIIAPSWNGASGGMIVMFAVNNIDLNGHTIDASGTGFRGGAGRALSGAGSGTNADYITSASKNANGSKGEGIAGTPKYINDNGTLITSAVEGYPGGSYAKGAPGNAGGGGTDGNPKNSNDQNTGGGGGGNGGAGGSGGWAWSSGTKSGGLSGATFAQVSPSRLVLGGGGGSGTSNDGTGSPNNGFASSGSSGGGIIILEAANQIIGTGTIKANGADANATVLNDGAGGGGAGGSVLIYSNKGGTTNITVTATGGAGGVNEFSGGPSHGPGGGGGGGIIYSHSTLNAASSAAGGAAGTTNGNSTSYGATGGSTGVLSQSVTPAQTLKSPLSCAVLATSFVDIAARQEGAPVLVRWTVDNDDNAYKYFVEKSYDGSFFTVAGTVSPQAHATSGNEYEYSDQGAFDNGSTVYYRVREVENSGNIVYSKIVSVSTQVSITAGKLTVYPNPARESATVAFTATTPSSVTLRLFDLKGMQIWQQQFQANTGQNTVRIDAIRSVPAGLYILQWSDGLTPQQAKIMVSH